MIENGVANTNRLRNAVLNRNELLSSVFSCPKELFAISSIAIMSNIKDIGVSIHYSACLCHDLLGSSLQSATAKNNCCHVRGEL